MCHGRNEATGDGETAMTQYRDDPRWITAKYAGKAADGTQFRKGDRVFYYPKSKTILVGEKADQASRDFAAACSDECSW